MQAISIERQSCYCKLYLPSRMLLRRTFQRMSLHSQPQLQIYCDNSVRRHCTRLCLCNYCNCQWKKRSWGVICLFQLLQILSCEKDNSQHFIHTWRLLSLLPFSDIVSMLLPRLPNAFLSICSITHSEKSNVWRSNTINSAIQINIIVQEMRIEDYPLLSVQKG